MEYTRLNGDTRKITMFKDIAVTLLVAIWTLTRKLIGMTQLWYFIVVNFRHYARNVVHNYTIQNNCMCKRMAERNPEWDGNGWKLNGYEYKGGYIKYRKVNKLWYLIVKYTIWGWLDDDSRNDTYEMRHTKKYINGTYRFPILHDFFDVILREEYDTATGSNYFEMGDKRAEIPCTGLISQLIWNGRNAAYNFNYMDDNTFNVNDVFMLKIGDYKFGYEKEGSPVNGIQWYIRRIGKNW